MSREDIEAELAERTKEWDISSEVYEAVVARLEDIEQVQNFIVLNGAASDPDKYEEDAVDLHILTPDYLVIVEGNENQIEESHWKLEELGVVEIDQDNQRMSATIIFDIGTGARVSLGTYENDRYQEIRDFIEILKR